jgi:NADPH2:quinone reductase
MMARREDLEAAARRLFDMLASGAMHCEVKRRFKPSEAAEAHRALGQRETTGSSILLP